MKNIEYRSEKLELFFSLRNLPNLDFFSKTDAKIILYSKSQNNWNKIGESEVIWDNLNPDFSQTIILEYYFEIQQYLKVEVINVNDKNNHSKFDLVGYHEFELGKVIGDNKAYYKKLINDENKERGYVIIRYDKICKNKKIYTFDILCKNIKNKRWLFFKSSPFIKFYKYKGNDQIDDQFDKIAQNQWILTYKTNFVKKNWNPAFRKNMISTSKFCSNNEDLPLKLEVWDYHKNGSHKLIGYQFFRLSDLNTNSNSISFKLFSKNDKTKFNGFIKLNNFTSENEYDIIDYIRSGLKIQAGIAIDFTSSNGDPIQQNSLHYFDPNNLNHYQKAIFEISSILLNYDHDKLIPLYGFGFKIPNDDELKKLYPLSFSWDNVEVNGIDSIMNYYQNALSSIIFSGPTYFSPIIEHTISDLRNNNDENEYFVLTILTDGLIHDMNKTIDLIVEASELPLSIIIIGIGNEDFTKMEILDGDDNPLISSKGVKWKRDIVQFVPFKKYNYNQIELTKEVLYEIPTQINKYFSLKNKKNINNLYQNQPSLKF